VEFVGVGVDRRVSEEGTEEVEGGLGLAVVDDWFAGHDGDIVASGTCAPQSQLQTRNSKTT